MLHKKHMQTPYEVNLSEAVRTTKASTDKLPSVILVHLSGVRWLVETMMAVNIHNSTVVQVIGTDNETTKAIVETVMKAILLPCGNLESGKMEGEARNISVKWSHNGEFHRFGINAEGPELYSSLFEKVQSMTPFTGFLAWKDEDGDLIVFSTDDELQEAIRATKDGVLRIFSLEKQKPAVDEMSGGAPKLQRKLEKVEQKLQKLVEKMTLEERMVQGGARKKTPPMDTKTEAPTDTKTPPNPTPDDAAPKAHPHVVCDNCETQITGDRYKCTACPDFDLCADCEGKEVHNHHAMIRIADPQHKSWKPFWNRGWGGAGMMPLPMFRGMWGPGCGRGRGWRGQGRRCQRQENQEHQQNRDYGTTPIDRNQWDDLTELFDKCHDGQGVVLEDTDLKMPVVERIKLETLLLSRVEEGLAYLEETCKLYHARRKEESIEAQRQYCKFLIRTLDRLYGEVHSTFLEIYIQQ